MLEKNYAQAASGGSGGGLTMILMMAGLMGLMYFMMIRPQQKRRKDAERMQSELGIGDEVVTIGGLHGVVAGHDDDTVTIEAHPDVFLRFARPAIARVVTKTEAPEPPRSPRWTSPSSSTTRLPSRSVPLWTARTLSRSDPFTRGH